MRKFLLNILFFISPFLVLFAVIGIVDPYDFFRESKNERKRHICKPFDWGFLQYTIDYKRAQNANMIFGASRPDVIQCSDIPENDWGKMTFGGATIPEYLQAFWYCTEFGKLKKIIIATDVYGYLYSFPSNSGRYDGIIDLVSHPYRYFYSQFVWNATWAYLESFTPSTSPIGGGIKGTNDEMWLSRIKSTQDICLNNMPKSENELYEKIAQISSMFRRVKQYCDDHIINVVVITPIISIDIYNMYMQHFPIVYDMVMRNLVDIFGTVVDYGWPNAYTSNKQNFSDPMHVKSDSLYIRTMWHRGSEQSDYCRYIDRSNIDEILKKK